MANETQPTHSPASFKSFRNAPSKFVEEAVGGLVTAHPYADWHNDGFIGLKRDPNAEAQVAVISGGGSGHEPMHAGFIGRGMLDAACPGLLFTSPNAVQITAATNWADRGLGVVHVVKNYTGDVMNFTVAAQSTDAQVRQVLVADDVATDLGNDHSPGRRVAGAKATRGMQATKGRASYLGESAKEVPDPGAISISWLFGGAAVADF